ncbi:MAG TPA: TolC family protein [Candidatus Saccharimonadales bacterium]|jgi:outer membrane protein|nr:TolC family protein [Candidatus Saccharimonadales bacterium]
MTTKPGPGAKPSPFWLAFLLALAIPLHAQEAPQPPASNPTAVSLTLKHAVELALQNSTDIQVAKLQARLADRSAMITKSQFLPNLYAGSGAGYTFGIPETPGGRAPALFDVTYTEQVFNEPLRGQGKELAEQAKSQKILLEDARNNVIVRTASTYLELGMVRHSLELLRKEQESAEKILTVTQQRERENYELPVAVTKDQLTTARVVQRILQLEGRQDELEVTLRSQTGLAENTQIEITPEDLPGIAEQVGANLVAMALQGNVALRVAQSDVRAKEFRLIGEKRGYFPTLEFVSIYSLLGKFNNYDQFFKTFERNNFNAGIQVNVPIFSAQTKANIALAQVNLEVAKAQLANKKTEISAAVRVKTRRLRERDAAKEVARLELQLSQQNVAVFQSQFAEGKVNVREVEKARLEESDKWMAYLDANFQRQQAQLDLLQTAGQLDKVWQ